MSPSYGPRMMCGTTPHWHGTIIGVKIATKKTERKRGVEVADLTDAEKRERAVEEYKNGAKGADIAEKYGVNINTLKSWVRRDLQASQKSKVAEKKKGAGKKVAEKKSTGKGATRKRSGGGQPGNKNAAGHGAPLGNRNALKHGGYSRTYWDTLTEEERDLIGEMEMDGETLLVDEITLLSIRERRIMANIKKHTEAKSGQVVASVTRTEEKREFASEEERELYEERQQEKIESGDILPGHVYRMTTQTEATYDVIGRLEEALTRCQAQKQKLIQSLNELRIANGYNTGGEAENNLLEALINATSGEIDLGAIPEIFGETEHRNDVVESSDA